MSKSQSRWCCALAWWVNRDFGLTITLVRTDVVPGLTLFEPNTVQLRIVTGELAPLKGKGMLTVTVGERSVRHQV